MLSIIKRIYISSRVNDLVSAFIDCGMDASGDFSNDEEGLVSRDELNIGSRVNGWSCFVGRLFSLRMFALENVIRIAIEVQNVVVIIGVDAIVIQNRITSSRDRSGSNADGT